MADTEAAADQKPAEALPAATETAAPIGTTTASAETEAPAEPKAAVNEPAPATTEAGATNPPTTEDTWPEIAKDSPLATFLNDLPTILQETDYNEVYGVELVPSGSFSTKLILQKFLRANANDLAKAKEQLTNTLKWRKEFQPLKAKEEVFSLAKFGGLGWVTKLEGVPASENKIDVVTFNIYGAVKSNKETFGDLDAFIRWRVALMELSVGELGLATATKPIPNYGEGPDPYQGFQVHDYMNVSFLRQDPLVKAASGKAIQLFGAYYPETMSRKFFVSVPLVMSWMFQAMRIFISKDTQKKFTVMSYATNLAGDLGPSVPEAYGGKGQPLDKIGQSVKTE